MPIGFQKGLDWEIYWGFLKVMARVRYLEIRTLID